MFYLKVLLIIIFFNYQPSFGQIKSFDSVKLFTFPFYSESPIRRDYFSVIAAGDTAIEKSKETSTRLYNNLIGLIKKNNSSEQKQLRKEDKNYTINVNVVFIFYKGNKQTFIGLSPQQMMFVDKLLYFRNNKKVESTILPILKFYKLIFPTRGDIINRE